MQYTKKGGASRPQNESLIASVTLARRTAKLDPRRARQYLTGIENLAHEARSSTPEQFQSATVCAVEKFLESSCGGDEW